MVYAEKSNSFPVFLGQQSVLEKAQIINMFYL